VPPRSQRRFDHELEAYLDWLAPQLAAVALVWDDIAVEEHVLDEVGASSERPGVTTEQLAVRFAEILNTVSRDWVNLTASTVNDRRLILVVEWCSKPPRETSDGLRVSVNWSGLSFAEVDRLTSPERPS
jgi:hypothetical protein